MYQPNLTSYPFAWLDDVIEITLNPNVSRVKAIQAKQLASLRDSVYKETRQVEKLLREKTFQLRSKSEIQTVAENYCIAIRELLFQTMRNLGQYSRTSGLVKMGQEIHSLLESAYRRITTRYQIQLPEISDVGKPAVLLFKLLIKLSGDQLGILIRAAFEAGLLDAPSKRAAYKAITPFLSSKFKANLSGDSLRSNAGRPEKNDVDQLINVLQRVLGIIEGYRRHR